MQGLGNKVVFEIEFTCKGWVIKYSGYITRISPYILCTLWHVDVWYYNPGQYIWHQVKKSSKIGQDLKIFFSNLAGFLTAIVKV